MIILMLAVFPACWTQQMSLCEYFNRLGVKKAECGASSVPHNPLFEYAPQFNEQQANPTITPERFALLPLCTNYFHSCMQSLACESGTVCTSGFDVSSCCTNPSFRTCPSPTQLNIQCRKQRGVSWCTSDFDCHGTSTMPSICCPSGCNYNMCVRMDLASAVPHTRRHIQAFSSLSEEETCPDPYSLRMHCTTRRTTSWCLSDAECPSVNSRNPRKCCATGCGYNACLIKYSGTWMVA